MTKTQTRNIITVNLALWIIASTLALLASAASAQVGLTNSLCKSRFGIEPLTLNGQATFGGGPKVTGTKLVAEFREGICVSVKIFCLTKEKVGMALVPLTQQQQESWLHKNSPYGTWEQVKAAGENREWKTKDGALVATYDVKQSTLLIQTASERDRQAAAKTPSPP